MEQKQSNDQYPHSHVQAEIMADLEKENRNLRIKLADCQLELQTVEIQLQQVQMELQDYKNSTSLNDNINNIEEEKENKEEKEEENQSSTNWEKLDYYLRTHSVNYIKDLIVKEDININETDERHENMTLLMKSCMFGNYDIAELLLHCDARTDYKSNQGSTAINYAEEWANYHISQLLEFDDMGASLTSQVKEKIDLLHKQNGLSFIAINNLSNDILDGIVNLMIYCIDNRLPFSDDMMNIAWKYINKQSKKPTDSILFQSLLTCYNKIINDSKKNERDWSWLQNYLMKSTIWLNIHPHDQDSTLFKELFIAADEANKKLSKDLLISEITKMKETHNKLWKELKKFNVKDCENPTGANQVSIIRQDEIKIKGVIKAQFSKQELLRLKPFGVNFNPITHYDFNEYLNKLYFRAIIVDETFQNDVQVLMNKIISKDESIYVKYKRGPIKLFERCIKKIESKYALQEFPKSAHLLDINRCSLTFNDLPSMIKGINLFIQLINSSTNKTCIKRIVRCKNFWNPDDFNDSQPTYSDIKFNVVIDIGNDIVIIGEIQILLKLMENFKLSLAHKYYGIFRQQEFIDNFVEIKPLMMDKQTQLFTFACNGDKKAFLDLIVTYNIQLNELLSPHKKSGKTILSKICEFNHIKLYKLLKTMMSEQEFIKALQITDNTEELWSPIGEALNANSTQIIDILCKQYPSLMINFHFFDRMRSKHSLHFAAQNNNIQYLKWYLNQIKDKTIDEKRKVLTVRDENGYIPLLIACNYSQIDFIEYMMKWAANENIQNDMMFARDNDAMNEPLMLAMFKGNKNTVSCLLSNVISTELRLKMIFSSTKHGLTPLICASLSNSNQAIECGSILMNYIKDDKQRIKYIDQKYNDKTASEHTKNDKFRLELENWKTVKE